MDYKKYQNPKANKSTDIFPSGSQSEVEYVNQLLLKAKRIPQWDGKSSPSIRELRDMITTQKFFGVNGDRILQKLIIALSPSERNDSVWLEKPKEGKSSTQTNPDDNFNGVGKHLLCWMLRDRLFYTYFIAEPSKSGGKVRLEQKKPIHLAIEEKNLSFLACFLGICYDPGLMDLRPQVHRILEETETTQTRNCIHHAIEYEIPFASFLTAVCSAKALKAKDSMNYTPLHIALEKKKAPKSAIPEPPFLIPNNSKAPTWDDCFDPPRILQAILNRENDPQDLIATILTTTNKEGNSPFQENLERYDTQDRIFRNEFKQLIFSKVEKISDISKALYGAKGDVKELCLDMSDFNQSSHNFELFVKKLTQLEEDLPDKKSVLQFEDTLFFVHLPDLNYVKQPCPHHTIHQLFDWLSRKGVRTIKRLSIPDNTTNPLSDAFVQQYILDVFEIEELDWRKLDVNLEIITDAYNGDARPHLKDLTLYSSGNWSVLHHWISMDGLAKLENLRKVRINIIHLNPTEGYHDAMTHDHHLALATRYKLRLEKLHTDYRHWLEEQCTDSKLWLGERYSGNGDVQREDSPNVHLGKYELDVKVDANWEYPLLQEPEEPTTQILKHQFTGQLLTSLNALGEWERASRKSNSELAQDQDQEREQHIARFKEFALGPPTKDQNEYRSLNQDMRIKVAIIDNGADRIRSKFRHMIAKGKSYVTADMLSSDRSLPWWMVSDPHGTQMASLIGQMNGYCRLYIARVGKSRDDIQPANAAKAINWAVTQGVDIISISWTLKKPDKTLEEAIKNAAQKTIIFCSTPDEGVYSEAWPVGYKEHVLSVSATDRHGHLTSQTKGAESVDIQIPGEDIRATGPSYIGNVLPTVSGSSVATALAAGIASLSLLLLKIFNPPHDERLQQFRTKEGINRVFAHMGAPGTAIQLSKLFPSESKDESQTLQTLAQNWNVENFL
ncbi:hypothetical protein F5B19DRAFT_498003 [Rostrohypoxylon terebratum]|nr:hypothetical protein F5B19DRAFT_498003 [Rostrohypoxylon terebratum]